MKITFEIYGSDNMTSSQVSGRMSYVADSIRKCSDLSRVTGQVSVPGNYGETIGAWEVQRTPADLNRKKP
jgi:hypothetical protein